MLGFENQNSQLEDSHFLGLIENEVIPRAKGFKIDLKSKSLVRTEAMNKIGEESSKEWTLFLAQTTKRLQQVNQKFLFTELQKGIGL